MDIYNGPAIRLFLSQTLFGFAAILVAVAIALVLPINDPQDRLTVVACCAVPMMLIHLHFAGGQFLRDIKSLAEKEERDLDRAVNARRPK